jgi:hypothetical protein
MPTRTSTSTWHRTIAEGLRSRLIARIQEAGGPAVTIEPSWFPYS